MHLYNPLVTLLLGPAWLEGWKSGMIENWWEDRKNLVFPHVYLVGGIENSFFLVEEKSERIENVVYINLIL